MQSKTPERASQVRTILTLGVDREFTVRDAYHAFPGVAPNNVRSLVCRMVRHGLLEETSIRVDGLRRLGSYKTTASGVDRVNDEGGHVKKSWDTGTLAGCFGYEPPERIPAASFVHVFQPE